MGWETKTLSGIRVITHDGSFDNFLSVIGFMPDHNIGFALLANTEAPKC